MGRTQTDSYRRPLGGAPMHRAAARRLTAPLLGVLVGALLIAPAGALARAPARAAAEASAPSWSLALSAENEYGAEGTVDPFSGEGASFERESAGNIYSIEVANSGGEAVPAQARVVVRDLLPHGVVPAWGAGAPAGGQGWRECRIEPLAQEGGRYLVLCERQPEAAELAPGRSYPPILIHLYVEAGVAGVLSDSATVAGGGGAEAQGSVSATVRGPVPFGIFRFTLDGFAPAAGREAEGGPERIAGAHPLALTTSMVFNFNLAFNGKVTGVGSGPGEFGVGPRRIEVALPPGLIGNPQSASAICALRVFLAGSCPSTAAVGYVALNFTQGSISELKQAGQPFPYIVPTPLFDLVPPPGHLAAFGFIVPRVELPLLIIPSVRSDRDYGINAGVQASGPVRADQVTFCSFGVIQSGSEEPPRCAQPVAGAHPFLSYPTSCGRAPRATLFAEAYPSGTGAASAEAISEALLGGASPSPSFLGGPVALPPEGEEAALTLTGCESLNALFQPTLSFGHPSAAEGTGQPAQESLSAGAPSGMTFTLNQSEASVNPLCGEPSPGNVYCPPIAPELKTLTLSLPEGVTLSASSAAGLGACTNAQFGLGSEFGNARHPLPAGLQPSEPAQEGHCPLDSKIGQVEVLSPDLEREPDNAPQLKGSLYVAAPECSPCSAAQSASGELFRLFLELRDQKAGVIVKLEGQARPNLQTGRLTTTFEDQPQLPFQSLIVHLKGGARAPLSNPLLCAPSEQSQASLTTYASESPLPASAPFNFPCPPSVPFSPAFSAGSMRPAAGAYSPFALTLLRGSEAESPLQGLEVQMPPGLTAKIAGVPRCGEAQANAGTCPPESLIGSVQVQVGAGPHPYPEQGRVYLTGPYAGGPFGLSIVVPTSAGPFALEGNSTRAEEVVRSAIYVNPETAAVSVRSDPLPQILGGVPLRIGALHVEINRPGFELNPTGCAPRRLSATLSAASGQSDAQSVPFQVGSCASLAFAPRFSASTSGHTSRLGGASLGVSITQAGGEANIAKSDIQLPAALPSRLVTLQHACTEAQFASNPAGCPAQSFVGSAIAKTPLLESPLQGPAILVSHGGAQFPDLHFLLEGQGVKIDLVGNTQIKHGITYSRFEAVPDTPIESFQATFPEGPHSLLSANGNLCKEHLVMPTALVAQDGAQLQEQTQVKVVGCAAVTHHRGALARALRACRRAHSGHPRKRKRCEAKARRRHRRHGRRRRPRKGKAIIHGARASGQAPAPGSAATTPATEKATPASQKATPAQEDACPNQARIAESNIDPATGRPYSEALPECRAYELVSPLEKGGQNIAEITAVAAGGDAVGYTSPGAFERPASFYEEGSLVRNSYLAHRVEGACPQGQPACWINESAFAPSGLIAVPNLGAPLASDLPANLTSPQIACGVPPAGLFGCALRGPDGSWEAGPSYWPVRGLRAINADPQADMGQSADLSTMVVAPGEALLGEDGLAAGGLYELSDLFSTPRLRLVNVFDGQELGLARAGGTPLLGDASHLVEGTAYHALSESGNTIYFSAEAPTGAHLQQLFARVPCESQASSCEPFREADGSAVPGSGRETVQISASECEGHCSVEVEKPATFEGASASGSRVFFTTEAQLLPDDHDNTADLYEYSFAAPPGHRLTLLSRGEEGPEGDPTPGTGAEVRGVVRVASEGSRVYFVAGGVLTRKPNALGQRAIAGGANLYVVQSEDGSIAFVATLAPEDQALWGQGCVESTARVACDSARPAQLTPDGRDLLFSTHARLDPHDRNGCRGTLSGGVEVCSALALYLYDAQSGSLLWISHAAPGFVAANEGHSARILAPNGLKGSFADYQDVARALSGCPAPTGSEVIEGCPGIGAHDGEYVIFSSREALARNGANRAANLYLWHCASPCAANSEGTYGTVSLISPPGSQSGSDGGVISASGSDIFFTTEVALVPQDTDTLIDLYDARIDGGIPASAPPAECSGEACQGPLGAQALFFPPGSQLFDTGANLAPLPPEGTLPAPARRGHKAGHKHRRAKRHRRAKHDHHTKRRRRTRRNHHTK
jgi:hypothetical protein